YIPPQSLTASQNFYWSAVPWRSSGTKTWFWEILRRRFFEIFPRSFLAFSSYNLRNNNTSCIASCKDLLCPFGQSYDVNEIAASHSLQRLLSCGCLFFYISLPQFLDSLIISRCYPTYGVHINHIYS